jgi:Tfp pilus assembly PilM family ATPase
MIKNEAGQLVNLFESHGSRITKIILCGAGSKLPGVTEYFAGLNKPVTIADPWSHVAYPKDLKNIVTPLGLNLAVAIGLSMRA